MGGFYRREAENPDNRFESLSVEWEDGVERPQEMRVYRETAKTVLTRNDSPDIPFAYTVNPYRGCAHACAYCYARPYHEYLGWGAGTDFDTRIVAKINAPYLLDKELSRPGWRRETLVFSGVTDCYQPAERALRLTRGCLEACLRRGAPVAVITKSALVLRDLDLLAALAAGPGASVALSIPFGDPREAGRIEPFAPAPRARFQAMEKLSAAGVRTGLSISPVIPGWNDGEIPRLLARARESGADFAFYTLLRLPGAAREVFLSRLRASFPQRAGKVEHHLRAVRGGALNQSAFGRRFEGQGQMAEMIERLFRIHVRKNGLNNREPERKTEPPNRTAGNPRGGTGVNSLKTGDEPEFPKSKLPEQLSLFG